MRPGRHTAPTLPCVSTQMLDLHACSLGRCNLKKRTLKYKTYCTAMRFDLARLYYNTYIMIVLLTVYLCSTSAYSLKRIPCFKDLCEREVQYCVEEKERCYYCKDVVHNCGTDSMPLQCDAFCRDVEAIDREKTINRTFENYNKVNFIGTQHTNLTNGGNSSQGYKLPAYVYILIGLLVLSVIAISGLVLFIYSHNRARTALTKKRQDEEDPLMSDADIIHPNKEDKNNRDQNRESLKADDAEMELQKDVSLQDEIKRDSKVSEDSAVGSLRPGDDVKLDEVEHRNDESVPEIEVGQGESKHCGPTQDNTTTGKQEHNNPGLQNMNPTVGENAKNSELVVNTEGSPLHKLSDSMVHESQTVTCT